MQVPPGSDRSASATRLPTPASRVASGIPAWPLPTMNTSKSIERPSALFNQFPIGDTEIEPLFGCTNLPGGKLSSRPSRACRGQFQINRIQHKEGGQMKIFGKCALVLGLILGGAAYAQTGSGSSTTGSGATGRDTSSSSSGTYSGSRDTHSTTDRSKMKHHERKSSKQRSDMRGTGSSGTDTGSSGSMGSSGTTGRTSTPDSNKDKDKSGGR